MYSKKKVESIWDKINELGDPSNPLYYLARDLREACLTRDLEIEQLRQEMLSDDDVSACSVGIDKHGPYQIGSDGQKYAADCSFVIQTLIEGIKRVTSKTS